MTLNWEVIKRFMTRSFEKSVDFYMLSDKNYVIPMDKMYEYIDTAIQSVFTNPDTANPQTLLQTANSKLQSYLDKNFNN